MSIRLAQFQKRRPARTRHDHGPRRGSFVVVAAAIAWAALLPPTSHARVNPLTVIEQQIHKGNMLIVLDTSGSMTGVPGGQFSNATEAGVDCDNGSKCRMGGVLGECKSWGRACMSDDDCQHGVCSKDGISLCKTTDDCTQDGNTCQITGEACTRDNDCPVQSGTCQVTGETCKNKNDCPTAGTCKYTQAACTNPGGKCADVGVCEHASGVTCVADSDCPAIATAGYCSIRGTPKGGCSGDDDCPSLKVCAATGDSCRIDAECPSPSFGICSGSHKKCTNSGKCAAGETCWFPANLCVGFDNTCVRPQDTCALKTDNACVAATNACNAPSNPCVTPPANTCLPPKSESDVCVPSPHGTPGPIRMCRISQTVCKRDSDCPASGDLCAAATSRAVIAKRAVTAIVNGNHDMLNFGLMTFYQKGYFPYFLKTTSATELITVFVPLHKVANSHCWDNHTGPAQTCRVDGITMKLRTSGGNARYRTRTPANSWVDLDHDWCGHTCDMPGDMGLGHFEGAYYQYLGAIGANSTTMIVRPSYEGPEIVVDGQSYVYYQPLDNYYNGGAPPPLEFSDCDNACSETCGGRWDTQLAPFLDTRDDPAISEAAATAITRAMAPAANGGLIFYWGTPTGCTLQNDVARSVHTSAYHYMEAVKQGDAAAGMLPDPLPCRENYVLLITDGAANGPGDDHCDSNACAAADPVAAGCACRSVLAAYNLRKNLGVRTFVVGFSGDVKAGPSRIVNDNIARAGGTDNDLDGVAPFAYLAQNEEELDRALELVVFNAVRGSYSTAPTSTSAGTQQATTVAEGRYALDSRMDFPEWRGHLLAYDVSGTEPVLAWDAYQKLATTDWWQRRVYTWDGTQMIKIAVDPTTKAVTNRAKLAALGLGASEAEAEAVARWLLGDPVYKNPSILGAIINSTPIDVASPGDIPQPGGHAYFLQHQNRPHLIYVGASDGLLHAFFLNSTTVGATTYGAGTEAFAFLPPDMMAAVRLQYAQGGQRADPKQHVFGIASSPKVKTLCVQSCADPAAAVWKTLLIMPEGYGGSDTFMLDVSTPFVTNGLADPPIQVQWHTGYGAGAATYDGLLGQTLSLPAYFFNKTSTMDDYRVAFASGYPVTEGSTTQGRAVITASAATGAIASTHMLTPGGSCAQAYTAMTDFAVARDFATGQDSKMVAGYFGDTSGQLHRYMLGSGPTRAQAFGCDHPLHFSPTVVQLDRDATTTSFAHAIFPVQVTNSNLDRDTAALPPSKIVFWKEVIHSDADGTITSVTKDTSWGVGGEITLTVGVDSQICGVTQMDAEGVVTCQSSMPLRARPTSTPLGVLLADASGFQIMTMWYVPAPDGCTRGQTYLTVHQMSGTGSVAQRVGVEVAHEPVTAPVILAGHIYVFGASGGIDITNLLPDVVTPGRAIPVDGLGSGMFRQLSWSEL